MLTRLLVILSLLMAVPAHAMNCSGTILTGGSAQFISGIDGNTRKGVIANNSANLMCIRWDGAAAAIAGTNCAAGSWALQPGSATTAGGSFYWDINGVTISVMSIISSTNGDRFS